LAVIYLTKLQNLINRPVMNFTYFFYYIKKGYKVRTRSTTKKLNHCLENQKGYYLRKRNTGKCSCCNSSQDD
jgi:hypothetical protein